MILPNPENFVRIEVSGVKNHYGFHAPYNVVGITKVMKPDPNWKGSFYEDEESTILSDGFKNFQVAEAWMKKYLDTYVSQTYFTTVVAFPAIDTNN